MSARETSVGPVVSAVMVTAGAGAVAGDGVVAVAGVVAGGLPETAAPVVAVPVVACRLAWARTSPVFTSITTAVPLKACEAAISAARACSATYWMDSSMVSSTPVPGLAATEAVPPGSVTPSGASSRLFEPAFPARRDWYWYSSPDAPLPSQLTDPRRGDASWPAGSTRCVSGTRLMPARLRAVTRLATASGTRWARYTKPECSVSSDRSWPVGIPSTGESASATVAGWVISSGSATTVCLVTVSASTSPLRS